MGKAERDGVCEQSRLALMERPEGRARPTFFVSAHRIFPGAVANTEMIMKTIGTLGAFMPSKSKSETKADVTSQAAKNIIDAEVAKRDAKTARLREARMAREALEAEASADSAIKPKAQPKKRAR
jgi:hypothetical protein